MTIYFIVSSHVETVVQLSKGEIDHRNIKVEFSLEDVDVSQFRNSATYQQIKDRVKEQSGLNVSILYIAQVKKKCGLDVGENYNKPKTDNPKALQCPPEKEAAIQDALKWFGML